MSDSTIFENKNNNASNDPNTQDTAQKITTQDLYGPSNDASENIQNSEQIIQQQPINVQPEPVLSVQNTEPVMQQVTDFSNEQPGYYQTDSPAPNRFGFLQGNKKLVIGIVLGLFLVILIVIGLISRFGGGSGGNGISNATLTYWGLWEENKTLDLIINDFEKKNPGIKINYEKQDPEKYKERLVTRIKNNSQAPDIFTFHNTWVPSLTNSSDNILLPLPKDVVDAQDFKDNYFPVVQSDLTKNGAIYGIPQGIDTLSLFINTEIFEAAGIKPPATWEEFNTAAKLLTVKDDEGKIQTSGVALGTFDNITHAPDIISLLFLTNGINLDEIDKQEEYLKQALSYYTSFAITSENVWNKTLSPSRDMFISGKLAMYFGYSWDIFFINSVNKDLKFEIHPVPYLPSEGNVQNRVTIASYWVNGVSAKSKNQKEALLFMKFLGAKETLLKTYTESSKIRLFGMPYARKDLASTLTGNSLVYPFIKQADYAASSYFSADTYDTLYNGPLNDYLGNAIRQLTSSGGSVESATETFLQGVKQVRTQALK